MQKQKTPTASVGKVTLYAVGLPPTEFDQPHAEKLLKMENAQWSNKPFDTEAKTETGVADNSTNQNPTEG